MNALGVCEGRVLTARQGSGTRPFEIRSRAWRLAVRCIRLGKSDSHSKDGAAVGDGSSFHRHSMKYYLEDFCHSCVGDLQKCKGANNTHKPTKPGSPKENIPTKILKKRNTITFQITFPSVIFFHDSGRRTMIGP